MESFLGASDRQFSPGFCDVTADSQRSSLMCSTADNRSCSSEADEENSEEENFEAELQKRAHASPHAPLISSADYGASVSRPVQPCMGVSASALTQSSCKLFLNLLYPPHKCSLNIVNLKDFSPF